MPETAAPTAEATEDDDLVLDLRQRNRLTITQQVFGLEPYIIIRPTVHEGTGILQVGIEAGGGAELANAGAFLESVGEAMQSDSTRQGIAAAVGAAAAATLADHDEAVCSAGDTMCDECYSAG